MDNRTQSEGPHAATEGMIRLMRMHRKIIERRIDGMDIHHSQHRMLMKLSHMGKTASQKDLAQALDVSAACVARTLKALHAAGYIDKSEGQDGRRNEISILPAGEALIERSRETFQQIETEMYEGLTQAEIATLTGLLGRLYDNLCRM